MGTQWHSICKEMMLKCQWNHFSRHKLLVTFSIKEVSVQINWDDLTDYYSSTFGSYLIFLDTTKSWNIVQILKVNMWWYECTSISRKLLSWPQRIDQWLVIDKYPIIMPSFFTDTNYLSIELKVCQIPPIVVVLTDDSAW